MLTHEKNLRWLGIDMRAREVRRVAVVLTYVLFGLAVWNPSGRFTDASSLLFWLVASWSFRDPMVRQFRKARSWVQRVVKGFVLIYLVLMGCVIVFCVLFTKHGAVDFRAGAFADLLLSWKSVVGNDVLVDSANGDWRVEAIRRGPKLSARKQRRLAYSNYAVGLEGFAWYEYGQRFAKLDAEQRVAVEALHRENPRGKWMVVRTTPLMNDERLQEEEVRLRARVQYVLTTVLGLMAVGAYFLLKARATVSARWVMVALWLLVGLSSTLRQAMVLWSEPDPRAMGGELGVVTGVEA